MGLFDKCSNCHGTGEVNRRTEYISDIRGGVDESWQTADKCPDCDGTGSASHARSLRKEKVKKHKEYEKRYGKESPVIDCPKCGGSGRIQQHDESDNERVRFDMPVSGTCSRCRGSGKVYR